MTLKESPGYRYALWARDEKEGKCGRYVKKQAAAWLKTADGENGGGYIDEKEFSKICGLLKLIVHPDLNVCMFEGLEPYAWFLITAVFCTKKSDGSGYYETALLEIARKNFKTFTSAVIFIIAMLTRRRFSRFFSVAPDYKLSSELRVAVRKIIKVSPALSKHFKITREMITCKLSDTEYTPLAYSNDRMDGRTADVFLADEAGAMDSYPVEAMRASQITIQDRLGVIISTIYPNDNNVLIDEIDKAKKTLDGLRERDNYFALLYEPDPEVANAWETDDRAIFQSNPVTLTIPAVFDAVKSLREDAVLYENKRENFLCKNLNIMYKGLGTESYIDITSVRKCKRGKDEFTWRGKTVYLGMDLSITEDNTAVAMACIEDGKLFGAAHGFIPKDKMRAKMKKEGVNYEKLIKDGVCTACGDEAIDYIEVENYILSMEERFGVKIAAVGFDRYNALATVQRLERAGIECVEVKQHSSVLHSPTKYLKEQVLHGTFNYTENKLLEINFQNARCTEDTNLNKYVNKKKSAGKVDMVVALINAVYMAEQNELCGRGFVAEVF